MKTKTTSFFYDMVSLTSYNHSTHGLNNAAAALADKLRKKVPAEQKNDRFIDTYAFVVAYTVALVFRWADDVPDHFRELETWWRMCEEGHDALETYLYFNQNVPNQIWNELYDTLAAHLVQWKPAYEKMADNLTDEEKADPKFESAEPSSMPSG